jgi:hypothetical protein
MTRNWRDARPDGIEKTPGYQEERRRIDQELALPTYRVVRAWYVQAPNAEQAVATSAAMLHEFVQATEVTGPPGDDYTNLAIALTQISQPRPPSDDKPHPGNRNFVIAASLALGIALAVFLGILFLKGIRGDTGPSQAVVKACEDSVTQQLKAPASAKFGGEIATDHGGDQGWSVTGHVDSENGFGARLRLTWTCKGGMAGNGQDAWGFATVADN